MKTIHKFIIEPGGTRNISMPAGAEVLSVHVQRGEVCMWALVDTEARMVNRKFGVFGTGHTVDPCPQGDHLGPNRWHFLGTVLLENDSLVFHVFEARQP